MDYVKNRISSLIMNDDGASAAEYALILAIVGGGLAVAALALGNSIGISMNTTATCLDAPDSC